MFSSIAIAYGTSPEKMAKFWPYVKKEWQRQGVSWILPMEEKYTFENVINVRSQ
jgi:hypothetical protein